MRPAFWARAVQGWQQASTTASWSARSRGERHRSRRWSQTRSTGLGSGEQGGSGAKVRFGGTTRARAPVIPPVPAGLVKHGHGMGAWGDLSGQLGQEEAHGGGGGGGQHERHLGAGGGLNGGEEAGGGEALVAEP